MKPIPNNMSEQIQLQNKICTKCKQPQIIDNFSKNPRYKDGYITWCKSCMKIAAKKHYQNNKEHCNSIVRQYQNEHVEQIREYNRNRYKNDPSVKEYMKQYKETHKEQLKTWNQEWAKNNVERRRENKRRWDRKHRLDPHHRLSNNIRTSMYHALQGKKGYHKWESLVGYTLQDLINHVQLKLTPDMTWDNYGSIWQIDHITPKSWFKYQAAEDPQFKACWSLSNLQPKLKTENISKGNRYIG